MWTLTIASAAMATLEKLDKPVAARIFKYLKELSDLQDPKQRGKPLVANWAGYWRYRVGDYRVICRFENKELVIEVIGVGHRSDIY
jgi:mRNA interferase RelE/StbE